MSPTRQHPDSSPLYSVFEPYSPGRFEFCGFCYDDDDVAYFRTTPLRAIDADHARTLLWETADHWESTDVYRHYLPRILEALTEPSVEPLHPSHLCETLLARSFRWWPGPERSAVHAYLEALDPGREFDYDSQDIVEWQTCLSCLRLPPQELAAPDDA